MRRCAFPVLALLLLVGPASAKTIRGFVTSVDSPTSWEIDSYKIIVPQDVKLTVADAKPLASLQLSDIGIGTELQVDGDYNKSTHELKAKSVEVFFFDTRQVSRLTLLQAEPKLQNSGGGAWQGAFSADGQRIVVDDSTAVGLMPQLKEHNQAAAAKLRAKNALSKPPPPLNSLAAVPSDSVAYYQGSTQADGSVLATTLEFDPAGPAQAEEDYIRKWTPKIKNTDFVRHKPGQIKIPGRKFKLFPDREVQEYISRLGESLVPESQKSLPNGSPRKLRFSFYVADKDEPDMGGFPSGSVIVNSGLIASMDNEAQLAYMMSHEISRATEQDSWRDYQYHKGTLIALTIGGMVGPFGSMFAANQIAKSILTTDAYARSLENQADREALEWTLASGYDIREAPTAWQKLTAEYGDDLKKNWPICDSRSSYLIAELKLLYGKTDYSILKKDSDNFHRIAEKIEAYNKQKAAAAGK